MYNNEVNNEKKNTSKQILLSVIGVAILIVAVVGISYAAFSYSKAGSVVNTISTGTISMAYNETTNGISITEAVPMTQAEGIAQSGTGNVFDFTVTAKIVGNTQINFAVTAQEVNDRTGSGGTPAPGRTTDSTLSAMRTYCNALVSGDATNGYKVDGSVYLKDGVVVDSTTEGAVETSAAAAYNNCTMVPDKFIRLYLEDYGTDSTYTTTANTIGPKAYEEDGANATTGKPADTMGLTTGNFQVASGSTTSQVTYYYRLKMWVDQSYPVDGVARTYKVVVNVYGKGLN